MMYSPSYEATTSLAMEISLYLSREIYVQTLTSTSDLNSSE